MQKHIFNFLTRFKICQIYEKAWEKDLKILIDVFIIVIIMYIIAISRFFHQISIKRNL